MLDPNKEMQMEQEAASPDLENRQNNTVSLGSPETVDLYDANEGLVKRDGGPYLDVLEREQAEIRRAKIEGRQPDLDNPPPVAGTQLVTKAQLLEQDASRLGRMPHGVEPNVEPMATYEADLSSAADNPPDPRQKDWDNDTQTFRGDWDNDTQTDRGRPSEDNVTSDESNEIADKPPVNQENFTETEEDTEETATTDPLWVDESDANDGDEVADEENK